MKKNIIMVIIILICSMSLLLVLYYFNSKDIYYISENINNKNIELSMIKIENGSTTTITETPTEGIYTIDYNCDGTANITWINMTHKLKVKVTNTPLKCIIEFKKVPDKDINIVAIYVDNVQQPSNFEFDENVNYFLIDSQCYNIGGAEDLTAAIGWDKNNKALSISPFNKQTYCDVHFKTTGITFYDEIVNSELVKSDYNVDFLNLTGQGLFFTANELLYGEQGTKIYYYRGSVDNNWVSLGGYYWRIVRTTSEGGIKLIYSGDGLTTSSGYIGNEKYSLNANNSDLIYSTSNIKGIVDTWYQNWIQTETTIPDYLSQTAVFCNDTTEYDTLKYSSHERISISHRPSFACPTAGGTLQTNSSYSKSNNLLTYPIALLSSDELAFAGLMWSQNISESFIKDNAETDDWWGMSPMNGTRVTRVYKEGGLGTAVMNSNLFGIRPSISLKACVTYTSGNGSFQDPYTISYGSCP